MRGVSAAVWIMMGVAVWHFAVFVPDRFYGGIVGALLAAVAGAMAGGYLASGLEVPTDNPPGVRQALLATPGAVFGLGLSYATGSR